MKKVFLFFAATLFGFGAFAGDRMSNELMVVKTCARHLQGTSVFGLNNASKIYAVNASDWGTRVQIGINYETTTFDWQYVGGNFNEDGTPLDWGWGGSGSGPMSTPFPEISHELFVAMTSVELAKVKGASVLDQVTEVSMDNIQNTWIINLKYNSNSQDCTATGKFQPDTTPAGFGISCSTPITR